MLIDGFCVVHVISCLFALEQGSSGEDVCRPSHFYIKYLEGYNGRYWFRTSDLFDEVDRRRVTRCRARFHLSPPKPCGLLS